MESSTGGDEPQCPITLLSPIDPGTPCVSLHFLSLPPPPGITRHGTHSGDLTGVRSFPTCPCHSTSVLTRGGVVPYSLLVWSPLLGLRTVMRVWRFCVVLKY